SASNKRQLICIDQVCNSVDNRQSTYHVFLCDKTCDRCCRQLPYTESEWNAQDRKRMRDACKDRSALRSFFPELEMQVKRLHDLYDCVTHKDDRSCFDDIRLSSLKHGHTRSLQARELIFRELDDKEGFAVFLTCDPLHKQRP